MKNLIGYTKKGYPIREFGSLQDFYHRDKEKPKKEGKKRVEFHFIKPIEY